MLCFKVTKRKCKLIEESDDELLIVPFYNLKRELNKVKSSIELVAPTPSEIDQYLKITAITDRYKFLRSIIEKHYNGQHVTNAWIKLYEILETFSTSLKNSKLTTMHLCEAPGAFIPVVNHYVKSHNKNYQFDWHAQSLIETEGALEDDYKLIEKHRDRWHFGETGDGDILSTKNMIYYRKMKLNPDLVTSDVGISVDMMKIHGEAGYNHQEELLLPLNLAQIITALHILKQGANFIFKTFTFFEPLSLSILLYLTHIFNEVHIVKPLASRPANSEVYVVCKGCSKISITELKQLRNISQKNLSKDNYICKLSNEFLSEIYEIQEKLVEEQMKHIKFNIRVYNESRKDYHGVIKREIEKNKKAQRDWIKRYNLKKLDKRFHI